MGIESSLMNDDSGDSNPVEPLPSLLELHKQIRESGRVKREYVADPKPPVSDIEFMEKKPETDTDSFDVQKPYAP